MQKLTALTALTLALFLSGPVTAQQTESGPTNAPGADGATNAPGDDLGGAPLNSSDGMTEGDYQEEDLSRGVGNRLNQQQCIALGRYLQQTQTTVEVQQSLKGRGCL